VLGKTIGLRQALGIALVLCGIVLAAAYPEEIMPSRRQTNLYCRMASRRASDGSSGQAWRTERSDPLGAGAADVVVASRGILRLMAPSTVL
jgi:hypothetical protein